MSVSHLFAGVYATDYDSALAWYERLLGRPPDVVVSEKEAMWQVTCGGWIYVVADTTRAGTALITCLVDDLEAHVAELRGRAVAAGAIETLTGLVRKAVVTDPDGNRITFGEDLTPHEREGKVEIVLRPLDSGDERELARIHNTPEVVRWWDVPAEDFPWDEPEATRLTIEADGAVAGLIQYREETEPRYRHAAIDLFIDPALHGRGIGAEAVRRVVRLLIDDRGHHRVTIDPATENTAAVKAYESAGFRAVGVMRRSERDVGGDRWHDSLLMELLAREART